MTPMSTVSWDFPPPTEDTLRFDGPEVILIVAGVVLTLILLGVFVYVFARKEDDAK